MSSNLIRLQLRLLLAVVAVVAVVAGGGKVQKRRPANLDFSVFDNRDEDPSTPAPPAPRGDNTPVTPVEEKCDNSSTAEETTQTSGN
jgi:hypothetical protein